MSTLRLIKDHARGPAGAVVTVPFVDANLLVEQGYAVRPGETKKATATPAVAGPVPNDAVEAYHLALDRVTELEAENEKLRRQNKELTELLDAFDKPPEGQAGPQPEAEQSKEKAAGKKK